MCTTPVLPTAATREDHFILAPIESNEDYDDDPQVWDIIMVGAGVAGSALAFAQAKEGRRVLVLERDLSQPDRIVGELLQPGGYLMLKRLGLQDAVDEIDSQKVYGYALFKNGQHAVVRYPMEGQTEDVAGRSFHHGRFVQRMRTAAAALPNITMRQAFVKRLVNQQGEEWQEGQVVTGVAYKDKDGSERQARAHLTIVCDGMYSNLRKRLTNAEIKHPSFFVGVILRNCTLPAPNHGHVVLAKPSPILFYPISSNEVRCLVDVPGEKLPADLPEYLRTVVAPEVPDCLRPAFLAALDCSQIRTMQNKQLYSNPQHQPGALLLGDAFNMRHPLTGGGMTVALSDCKLLCDMLHPLTSLDDVMTTALRTADFYTRRKPVAATINTLANALYKVFCFTGDKAHEEMRQACFDYLSLGGMYSSGPISLLSGLNPRPYVLVMHFFMVALYGVGRLLLPRPTLKGLWTGLLLLAAASRIIFPIIGAEGVRAVFLPWFAPKPYMAMRPKLA
ncbi:SE-domain-containing protein [Haematococcus lacustris]